MKRSRSSIILLVVLNILTMRKTHADFLNYLYYDASPSHLVTDEKEAQDNLASAAGVEEKKLTAGILKSTAESDTSVPQKMLSLGYHHSLLSFDGVKNVIAQQIQNHPYAVALGISTALAYEGGLFGRLFQYMYYGYYRNECIRKSVNSLLDDGNIVPDLVVLAGCAGLYYYAQEALIFSVSAVTTFTFSRLAVYIYHKFSAKSQNNVS